MTIHHDKMAYGKLNSLTDEFSEERLQEMVGRLSGQEKPEREYDKMIRGELYNPADEELTMLRKQVRRLFYRYNNSEEDEQELRRDLLHRIFGKHGEHFYCEPPIRFDYGINTEIVTPVHPMLACDRNMRPDGKGGMFDYEYARPITIEDNVWLASNVTVCGGVTIGHDTVIGAGSVVVKDIPAGVFAAGNPCRVIRPITEKDKMKLPNE